LAMTKVLEEDISDEQNTRLERMYRENPPDEPWLLATRAARALYYRREQAGLVA